jgi:hypothetical protein
VCDLENLLNEEAIVRVGLQRHVKKQKKNYMAVFLSCRFFKFFGPNGYTVAVRYKSTYCGSKNEIFCSSWEWKLGAVATILVPG